MSTVVAALRKLWGLFVDDGSLALALILWCLASGLGLSYLPLGGNWAAAILFVGCLAILLTNIAAAVRRQRIS
jgi:hypothetical protein